MQNSLFNNLSLPLFSSALFQNNSDGKLNVRTHTRSSYTAASAIERSWRKKRFGGVRCVGARMPVCQRIKQRITMTVYGCASTARRTMKWTCMRLQCAVHSVYPLFIYLCWIFSSCPASTQLTCATYRILFLQSNLLPIRCHRSECIWVQRTLAAALLLCLSDSISNCAHLKCNFDNRPTANYTNAIRIESKLYEGKFTYFFSRNVFSSQTFIGHKWNIRNKASDFEWKKNYYYYHY